MSGGNEVNVGDSKSEKPNRKRYDGKLTIRDTQKEEVQEVAI